MDPLKALVAFEMRAWLIRMLLGLGVPEPKWWENPPKSLGFGSLQLGSSCGPGTGANPRWYHLFQLAHFSQPRQGGQAISQLSFQECGRRRKGVQLLKGLGRRAFSLETSQRLRVNYQERPGTAKFVLFTLMPQLSHPLTSHFLHLQNRVVNAWSCGLHKFRVYDRSDRAWIGYSLRIIYEKAN